MKPHIFVCLFLCALFSTTIGFSQDHSISGFVDDVNAQPVAHANVVIFSSDESVAITGTSTDELGAFRIENITSGAYILKISFIGYEQMSQPLTLSKDTNVGTITLIESAETLGEVSVIAKKPTVKRFADRLIFNVSNTALSEGSILDVLRNTPMVLISADEIKVKRSSPTVYINDRKINLSATEVMHLLESTQANSIKSVEVITTPGAKYDASSGTVLNIVMDKNVIAGYNGRVFGNYNQGVFPSYDGGISNLYKNEKISVSANYSYSKNKQNRYSDNQTYFSNNDNSLDRLWKSQLTRNTWSENHNVNVNFDYSINDNNTFSLASNILLTPYFKYRTQNETKIFNDGADFLSSFKSHTLSRDDKHNLGFDADYVSKFKDESKLKVNAHYTNYDYAREQGVNSDYFTIDNSFDFDTAFKHFSDQQINIITTQVDYDVPFKDDSSLSLGIKGSFIDANSGLTQFDVINNEDVLNKADSFDYHEEILASYVSYSKKIGDFNLQGGLRVEQTNIEGTSLNVKNTQDYLEWFPTLILSYDISETVQLYNNYRRTISRPSYQSLNPFEFFLNDKVIIIGNPNLQPSFHKQFELGVILNDNHTFEAHLGLTTGNINELPLQDNMTKVITYTPENIGKTTEIGFSYETNITVSDKLSFYFVTDFYYVKESTKIENKTVELDQWSNYSSLSGNMSFLKDNSLSTYFSFIYASKNLQGLQMSRQIFASELTISKTILNKRATISLIASDLFNTADFRTTSNYLNQSSSQFINLDNRYIKLGFSYKFGNTTLKNNENDKHHLERDRIKNRD